MSEAQLIVLYICKKINERVQNELMKIYNLTKCLCISVFRFIYSILRVAPYDHSKPAQVGQKQLLIDQIICLGLCIDIFMTGSHGQVYTTLCMKHDL